VGEAIEAILITIVLFWLTCGLEAFGIALAADWHNAKHDIRAGLILILLGPVFLIGIFLLCWEDYAN
jgi:hypothetical protein